MSWRGNRSGRGSARGRGGGAERGGGRHPAHLRGREIGLWYARNSGGGGKKELEEQLEPDISLASERVAEIRGLVNESKFLGDGLPRSQPSASQDKFRDDFLRVISVDFDERMLEKIACQLGDEVAEVKNEFDTILLEEQRKSTETELQGFRRKLPCWKKKETIVDTIRGNQVVVIKGETGCGKTTQVTQYILDDAIGRGIGSKICILCTQPRRISATSVAERVAHERGEPLGKSVGYSIRLDTKNPRSQGGTIKYCTTGVLLKYLEDDPALLEYSHVILDEVHERDHSTDITLAILKTLITRRKDVRVILMSATLKADSFSEYFNGCPAIEVEGFTYPVVEKYLEDVIEELNFHDFIPTFERFNRRNNGPLNLFEMFQPTIKQLKAKYSAKTIDTLMKPATEEINFKLIQELIFHISYKQPEGAILVFVPGYAQISNLYNDLTKSPRFPSSKFAIYPLHSMLAGPEQKKVFDRPPKGVRKVILATNIAETSITIDDIVYVVDAGKRKLTTYDVANNIQVFDTFWVSQANAIQRKGRAGRCQPGVCYRLYSRARFEALEIDIVPEILQIRLDDIILTLKLLGFQDVGAFLASLLSVPHVDVIRNSIELLKRLSALSDDEVLTPLGYHLAKIPVEPQAGKMILLASFFGCVDPITSVAASLGFKNAFYSSIGKEKEVDAKKLEFANNSKSDHLMLANVMDDWRKAKRYGAYQFCRENFLSYQTLCQLEQMKGQFVDLLEGAKFVTRNGDADKYSDRGKLVRAIICAGLYPNVAKVWKVVRRGRQVDAFPKVCTKEDGRKVKIFPGSVLGKERDFDSNYLVYFHKQKSKEIYLHDCSTITPYAILFFGDKIRTTDEWISVADFLCFKCNIETRNLILDLRKEWDLLLQKKIWSPAPIQWDSHEGKLMQAVIRLLTTNKDPIYEEGDADSD